MENITFKGLMEATFNVSGVLAAIGLIAVLAAFPAFHLLGAVKVAETLSGGVLVSLACIPVQLVTSELSR